MDAGAMAGRSQAVGEEFRDQVAANGEWGGANSRRSKPELATRPLPYHRSSVAPQVNPPPIASSRIRSPFLIRPSATATDSASGIDAAEVLPCLSTVITTFSGAMPSFTAEASMMRLLA